MNILQNPIAYKFLKIIDAKIDEPCKVIKAMTYFVTINSNFLMRFIHGGSCYINGRLTQSRRSRLKQEVRVRKKTEQVGRASRQSKQAEQEGRATTQSKKAEQENKQRAKDKE